MYKFLKNVLKNRKHLLLKYITIVQYEIQMICEYIRIN